MLTIFKILAVVSIYVGQRDREPASIGANWSGMQQQHATCTWALACIVVAIIAIVEIMNSIARN